MSHDKDRLYGVRRTESIYRLYSDYSQPDRDDPLNSFFTEAGTRNTSTLTTSTVLGAVLAPTSIALPLSSGSDFLSLLTASHHLDDDLPVRSIRSSADVQSTTSSAGTDPNRTHASSSTSASVHTNGSTSSLQRRPAPDDAPDVSSKKKARRRSSDAGVTSNAAVDTVEQPAPHSTTCWFEVLPQPKPSQRKSYKNENRYLSPNPITVAYVGDGTKPKGSVRTALADEAGVVLSEGPHVLVGERDVQLDVSGTAAFSLKMVDTSKGAWLRLHFTIELADGQRQWLTSARFRVDTNVRKMP